MARNMVQFQKGMSLSAFLEKYDTEEACQQALYKLRWPDGFRCPECGHHSHCQLKSRPLIQCNLSVFTQFDGGVFTFFDGRRRA